MGGEGQLRDCEVIKSVLVILQDGENPSGREAEAQLAPLARGPVTR